MFLLATRRAARDGTGRQLAHTGAWGAWRRRRGRNRKGTQRVKSSSEREIRTRRGAGERLGLIKRKFVRVRSQALAEAETKGHAVRQLIFFL